MGDLRFCSWTPPKPPLQKSEKIPTAHNLPSSSNFPNHFLLFSASLFSFKHTARVRDDDGDDVRRISPFIVLGVEPSCSQADLKAAFRSKVKQFYSDVNRSGEDYEIMIRQVIQAHEMLSNESRLEIIERECSDPFESPECEAFDVFVNEVLCAGKGCPYSYVKRVPHTFSFASSADTARAISQGHNDDYQIQLAVGQCPRNCIHYVTPLQRIILEELLDSFLNVPYDTSVEADVLYSLISKAKFENNRYRGLKKHPKSSTNHVDWY